MKKVWAILTKVGCQKRRHGRTLLVVLALVGASVASAQQGGDLCFRYGSGGGTLVARGAGGLPADDNCKPLQFYEDLASAGLAGAATGSICKAQQGGIAILHYSYHSCADPSHFQMATCRFSVQNGLPAVGVCRGTDTHGGFVSLTPILESCDIPVPEGLVGLCLD
jgi:hypothetical protein